MKKFCISFLFALFILTALNTQAQSWHLTARHKQISIWPKSVPDAQSVEEPEQSIIINNPVVAGKPWLQVGPISQPTITIYSPKEKNTGNTKW